MEIEHTTSHTLSTPTFATQCIKATNISLHSLITTLRECNFIKTKYQAFTCSVNSKHKLRMKQANESKFYILMVGENISTDDSSYSSNSKASSIKLWPPICLSKMVSQNSSTTLW